ncbi:ricin B lectin domain-containing protein, partial [Mycena rosella]
APRQVPASDQYIHLVNNFEKCLAAASDANGAAVEIEDCAIERDARQIWTVSGSTLQVFENMCLDVPDGATANGTPLQIWECTTGDTNQEWTLSGGTIQWSGEDSCLDLTNGNVTNGNFVRIPSYLSSPLLPSTECLLPI